MTDVIEKVARAIFEASPRELGRGPLGSAPKLTQRIARDQARAAILALREPTRAQVAAGEELVVRQVDVDEAALWRAMVDAALNGEPATQPVANDDYREELDSVMRGIARSRPAGGPAPAERPRAPLVAVFATLAVATAAILVLTLLYWTQAG